MSISSITINILIFFLNSFFVAIDCFAIVIFLKFIKQGQSKKAIALLIIKPIPSIASTYFVVSQFGGGFFAGAWYLYFSPFITVIMLIVFIIQMIKLKKLQQFHLLPFWFILIAGLFLVITIPLPVFTYPLVKSTCSALEMKQGKTIAQTIGTYYEDNETYPTELNELVPAYFPEIPSPSCNWISGEREFYTHICEEEEPFVFVKTVDYLGFDMFSIPEGRFSHLHSFLDFPDIYNCPQN